MNKILIVDDEEIIRQTFHEILSKNNYLPLVSSNGIDAMEIFKRDRPGAVLLDLVMPKMNGMEVMKELKKIDPDIPVIIITALGDISTAVEAIKLGAYDFIVKPADFHRLVITLKRAIEEMELKKRVNTLNTALEISLEWMLGKSDAIREVIDKIHLVASNDLSVVIQGETGAGKSLIARTIHNLSRRSNGPFIAIDIGAIPETLVESELFGYEKGAFTGAERKKKGLFEVAHRGTILIDELQNMSSYVQTKLLTVVDEKRVNPLGSTSPLEIDVRIISTTNRDIRLTVKENRFREDLFFRLGEFIITLPPLRDRVDDILLLAQRFLAEASRDLNKHVSRISDDAADRLRDYHWPGNVRELKNVIRKAVLISNDSVIKAWDMDFLTGDFGPLVCAEPSTITIKDAEKIAIKKALDLSRGNKTKAASILQIDYKTLLTKIKQYGIIP
ncbi:MAG: sigma-54 dependent transcriptional regulator [Nitrospirota bacterium]